MFQPDPVEYVPHTCSPYIGQSVGIPLAKLQAEFARTFKTLTDSNTDEVQLSRGKSSFDGSVYVGLGGLLHLYWTVYERTGNKQAMQHFVTLLPKCLAWAEASTTSSSAPGGKAPKIGYFCGPVGVYALAARVSRECPAMFTSSKSFSQEMLRKVFSIGSLAAAATGGDGVADEILFGWAGYIHAVLFAMEGLRPEATVVSDARTVLSIAVQKLIQHGKDNPDPTFVAGWPYRKTKYLGAAHGNAGILHALLCVWDLVPPTDKSFVLNCVHALGTFAVRNNGLPIVTLTAGDGGGGGTCVNHFCHGVPGVVLLLNKAYEVVKDPSLCKMSRTLVDEVLWPYGMLRKGVSLCHGAGGTAYVFLSLYRTTGDNKALYYANSYVQMILENGLWKSSCATYEDPQREVVGVPDHPLSLMEGDAGLAMLLYDMQYPAEARFPGFEPSCDIFLRASRSERSIPSLTLSPSLFDKTKVLVPDMVWYGPILDPSDCAELHKATRLDPNSTVEIQLGVHAYGGLIQRLTAYMQRFVEAVMLPTRMAMLTGEAEEDRPFLLSKDKARDKERKKTSKPAKSQSPIEMYSLHPVRAHVLRFEPKTHTLVQPHVDGADVTLNICIARTCSNGELVFESRTEEEVNVVYQHSVGEGTMFWGDVPHHTHAVTGTGERCQLVMLFRFMRPNAMDTDIKPKRPYPLLRLPSDCRRNIMLYLSIRDMGVVSCVCRDLNNDFENTLLWRELFVLSTNLSTLCTIEELEAVGTALVEHESHDPSKRFSRISKDTDRSNVVRDPRLGDLETDGFCITSNRDAAREVIKCYGPHNWKDTFKSVFFAHKEFAQNEWLDDREDDHIMYRQRTGTFSLHEAFARRFINCKQSDVDNQRCYVCFTSRWR